MKAVPVMKAMKAAAVPPMRGAPAKKAAAKAAALPVRGAVIKTVVKGKTKAVVAKTFKDMAASLKKSASTEAIAGAGT